MYPHHLEGSDKSSSPLLMGMKIPATNRADQCRVYRQHQGSASSVQPRNELIMRRWGDNKASQGSGVGSLSWTFATETAFLCMYVLRHKETTEELKSVCRAGVKGLDVGN